MQRNHLLAALFAASILLPGTDSAAQPAPPAAEVAKQSQFPQLPLKREPVASGAQSEALAWTAVLLIALAGGGWLLVKRRTGGWPLGGQRLMRPTQIAPPRAVARTGLTPQASLHVVEWHGEELLLGCTAQSVTVLARHVAAKAGESELPAKGLA